MAALLIRTTDWEEHLAEALSVRFPGLDPADAKVWGYTAMAMMRLLQQNAGNAGTNYADAARDVFSRLESLMTGRDRSTGSSRRARRGGYCSSARLGGEIESPVHRARPVSAPWWRGRRRLGRGSSGVVAGIGRRTRWPARSGRPWRLRRRRG